jgi:DNA-binding beta-propeller fold protein YncE
MIRYLALGLAFVASVILSGCGGGTASNQSLLSINVPGVGSSTNFSFDISAVDGAKHRMYFTDRNNKSVDVIDTDTNTFVKQITGGFAGCDTGPTCNGANNDKSGPDGLNIIPGTTFIYVGDVNSVKIIDTTTDKVVNTIAIGGKSGLRADEGCYDPDHQIFMINSPGESPPFATFIDVNTQKIIATLLFTDPGTGAAGPHSAGLEACAYDHATQTFLDNNDGSTANPRGEVDVIPASFVMQGTPAAPVILTLPVPTPANGFKIFPLGACDPTGLDLGPGTDMAVSCRQGTLFDPLTVEILDRTNGTLLATVPIGGGDQIAYDAATNSYYLAASRWTGNGRSSGPACTAAYACTPVLAIIDASTREVVKKQFSGNNAHSVGVDPVTHRVYMPYSGSATPAGCATCDQLPNGGVLVFQE